MYDNNSTDGTDEIAARAGAIVRHEYKQGKGNVIRTMFREIEADCYLMIDGDDTYPAENAPDMVRLILEKKADMVNGDRLSSTYFTENKRPFHNLGNVMVRGLINRLFHTKVNDIMTGYRAFSRDFVKTFPILSQGFEIETEMTIHAVDKNFLIREIPVEYRDRPEGSVSKLNTYADGMKVLGTIFKLYKDYKPMAFFGIFALVFLLASVGFFIPVLVDYIRTGLVPRYPTMIVSVTLALFALLSFLIGVVLDVIVKSIGSCMSFSSIFFRRVNMIRTHNRPLPPWVLWAGVLVSGGLTTLLFCYFDWPRHIVLMLLAAAVLLFLFKNALEERDRRVCVTGAVLGGVLSGDICRGRENRTPQFGILPVQSMGSRLVFCPFCRFLSRRGRMYTIVTRWNLLQDAEPDGGKAAFRYWLCMFALLLVCWMPSYLTFYPDA